ncbi:MAG: hypothetical protein HYZ54_12375 [Ignavibacteriae bacterium]|nr:hypothetical protein [Ignavibacteriota bacterium]
MPTCISNSEPLSTEGLTLGTIRLFSVLFRITFAAFVCFIASNTVALAQGPPPLSWGFYYHWNTPLGENNTTRLFPSAIAGPVVNPNGGIGGFNTTRLPLAPIEAPKRLFHIYSHSIPQYTAENFQLEPAYLRIQSDIGLIPIPLGQTTTRPSFSPAGIEFFSGAIDGNVDEQSATIQSFELNLNEGSDEIIKTQRKAIFNNPSQSNSAFENPRGLDILTMRRGTRGLLADNDQIKSMRILTTAG